MQTRWTSGPASGICINTRDVPAKSRRLEVRRSQVTGANDAVARIVLGEGHDLTLRMRWIYAEALYKDSGATLDDLHEAVTTLEDSERIARRVLGGAHPTTTA